MEATRSRWAPSSMSRRGWVGSGRMRSSRMEKAPTSRRRPCWAPISGGGGLGSGGCAVEPKVRSAAAVAAATEPFDAGGDLIEEVSGDCGLLASRGMEGDGDGVGDTLLEQCQIGNHAV